MLRRYRKWLVGTGCALVVLALVGLTVRAPVKDWWLAREACGGKLPDGDLDTVRTDARLGEEREFFDRDLGQYRCVLENDEGKVVVAVDAYLRESDRESELSRVGAAYQPRAVLPGGLPGFEDDNSRVYLMPDCPRAGKDPSGRERKLLVGTWAYFAESREEKAAMLRLAVRMTNEAREKLGCGGQPLAAPRKDAVPDTGRSMSRADAKGTVCDALATLPPPEDGRNGRVRAAMADGGLVGRCTLRAPGERGRPLVELTRWRGDWGGRVREMGSGPDPLPMSPRGVWQPALSEHRAWAVARCDGENTGFAAHWGYDYPYLEEGEKPKPRSAPERRADRDRLRAYVTAFAKDQVRRGGCTGLKVPR
ncbi:hypothetical protein [Streptomyces sp. NPDC048172]|uniref:hypothetical protein n=1 Tax=Streptomyces sp. NPDC048172 TaxID=3365505 RepID=UPI00371186EB